MVSDTFIAVVGNFEDEDTAQSFRETVRRSTDGKLPCEVFRGHLHELYDCRAEVERLRGRCEKLEIAIDALTCGGLVHAKKDVVREARALLADKPQDPPAREEG